MSSTKGAPCLSPTHAMKTDVRFAPFARGSTQAVFARDRSFALSIDKAECSIAQHRRRPWSGWFSELLEARHSIERLAHIRCELDSSLLRDAQDIRPNASASYRGTRTAVVYSRAISVSPTFGQITPEEVSYDRRR